MALTIDQFQALKPEWEKELERRRKADQEAGDRFDREWGEEIDKHPIGVGRGHRFPGPTSG